MKYRTIFLFLILHTMFIILLTSNIFAQSFGFGIEYIMPAPPDLPQIINKYREIGATWSKFNGPGTSWHDIEPFSPQNGRHEYRWEKIDNLILTAQKAGFKNLIVVLKSNSKWGTYKRKATGLLQKISEKRETISTPPSSKENWKHYKDYVSNFVERYDGDGKDDMPGLLYPVLNYEIETEAQHHGYWIGTAQEYASLLKAAYGAVKEANPDAKVILSGFAFFDIFDGGYKTDNEINGAIDNLAVKYPKGDVRHGFGRDFKNQLLFNSRILQEKDYFDIVEFHLLSYYTSIPGTVRWIKEEMHKNGYEKPIWMGDAGAVIIPSSNKKGVLASFSTYTIFSDPPYENGDRLFHVLSTKKDTPFLKYEKINRWFLKEQAKILVKSLVMAMGEGVKGANWWTWNDIPELFITNGTGKSWALCGLLEKDTIAKRPTFNTYKLLIQKIGRFSSVSTLNISSKIQAYKFLVQNKPVYVVWYDTGTPLKPYQKEKEIVIDLSSYFPAKQVKITNIFTDSYNDEPQENILNKNHITVTETPIFIEAPEN